MLPEPSRSRSRGRTSRATSRTAMRMAGSSMRRWSISSCLTDRHKRGYPHHAQCDSLLWCRRRTPSRKPRMKPMTDAHFAILRRHMVDVIAIHADLTSEEIGKAAFDERVIAAMRQVPRHLFVPTPLAPHAYHDMPLPIGFDKTISQPFIVALMTDLLAPEPDDVVLDIGTGLGYQAAILAELAGRVWSVEIVEEFATEAERRLKRLGYETFAIRVGDGTRGWAEHAPFDKILVAAASERPPQALLDQLKPGGRLIMPLGSVEEQRLTVFDKDAAGHVSKTEGLPVRFTQLETL